MSGKGAPHGAECLPTRVDAKKCKEKKVMSAEDVKKTIRAGKSTGSYDSPDPETTLKETLEKLKIKKIERSESSSKVNNVIKIIMDHMKKNTKCFRKVEDLRTGSYYENVKISNPDEFDVMLTIPVRRVVLKMYGDDGAFYSAVLKRGEDHELNGFLIGDCVISAYAMLKEFRKEVMESVKSMDEVKVLKKKKGCPAVTLSITVNRTAAISLDVVLSLQVNTSWPSITKDGLRIDGWLGKKVKQDYKREPYYLVPKYDGRGTVEREGIFARDVWRISFSHVEKSILKNHGLQKTCCEAKGSRCCRKDCLKLLKHLLSLLQKKNPSLSEFCSYHAKTALLHACCTRPGDSEWMAGNLSQCFQQLLEDFESHVKNRTLPNFFIPSQNLLANTKGCNLLVQRISDERNNDFPIFRE